MPAGSTKAEGGVDAECGGQCCVLGSSHRWSAVVHFCGYLVPSAAVLFIGSFKDTDWFGAKGMAERVRVFHKHEDLSSNP